MLCDLLCHRCQELDSVWWVAVIITLTASLFSNFGGIFVLPVIVNDVNLIALILELIFILSHRTYMSAWMTLLRNFKT